jgi:hypothetical protein
MISNFLHQSLLSEIRNELAYQWASLLLLLLLLLLLYLLQSCLKLLL